MSHKNCRLVSVIRNAHGDLLPYSTQNTQEQVREWADRNLAAGWKKHEEIGDKIEYCLLLSLASEDEMIALIRKHFRG